MNMARRFCFFLNVRVVLNLRVGLGLRQSVVKKSSYLRDRSSAFCLFFSPPSSSPASITVELLKYTLYFQLSCMYVNNYLCANGSDNYYPINSHCLVMHSVVAFEIFILCVCV